MTEPSCAHSTGDFIPATTHRVGERLSLPYLDGKTGRPGVIGSSLHFTAHIYHK
jgi:hypothetical protein